MDEISISSLVGEQHQPLNNALKDPHQNNSCSLSPNLHKREREREIQNGKEERRGGRRHRTKHDKIEDICEICQALIWNSPSVSRILGRMNSIAITSRWNLLSRNKSKRRNWEYLQPYGVLLDKCNYIFDCLLHVFEPTQQGIIGPNRKQQAKHVTPVKLMP